MISADPVTIERMKLCVKELMAYTGLDKGKCLDLVFVVLKTWNPDRDTKSGLQQALLIVDELRNEHKAVRHSLENQLLTRVSKSISNKIEVIDAG